MKLYALIPALLLIASGCTFTPGSQGQDAAFHPPLVEKSWQVRGAVLPNETKVCSISSGYNGITVFLSDLHGRKDVAVKSNRMMQPGATLTVTAGGGSVQSYATFFEAQSAARLVENLAKGGAAYLEWSEFSGPVGRERTHVQNIIALGDFSADLKECRAALQRR